MAYYAALASTMALLEERNRDHDRYPDFTHVKKQTIRALLKKLGVLLKSLDDYSSISSSSEESSDRLERRIRDVSYQARDIIEPGSHGAMISVYRILMHRLSRDLKEVKKEVDSILNEIMRIKEIEQTEDFQLNHYPAETGESKQAASVMVGFDEQLITIKDQLCSDSCKLQIVSLVGMGGIGKTTLARSVFDDSLIVYYFHIRVWVTVSQNYHSLKVLRAIRDSLTVVDEESREVKDEDLFEYIYKHLKGMRYLIVMDDMWDTQAWDDVKRILPDDSNGSRVLITTRQSGLANYANSVHEMQFLDKEQSWNMLREKVFAQEHCPRELEALGKSIAGNCRGLPLAIVVVAGVLSKIGRTRNDWKKIETNVSSIVGSSNDEHCLKILSLSYNHLPHHLKPCFLYFGALPEDYEISASRLINLWIAEGFLRPSESCESLEDLAKGYLEELVKRNLVLIKRKNMHRGELKSCSIHDVMRDLCIQRIRYEKFFLLKGRENENENPYATKDMENIRRICINHHDFDSTREEEVFQNVHSILHFRSNDTIPKNLLSFGSGFKLLKVFEALELKFQSFPEEIVKLFYLRYFACQITHRGHNITLPTSISKLQNLQTLIVHSKSAAVSRYFISLPSEIWNMPQLRHLIIQNMTLSHPEDIIGEVIVLENLQTLARIRNFIFTQRVLKLVQKLKKLKVRYTQGERYGKWQKYNVNNLVHLCNLQTLQISFYSSPHRINFIDPLPKTFAFPKSLTKLSLFGCQLPWKDLTVVGSLPNLEILKLKYDSFVGHEWESTEGGFVRLKFLLIERLNVKYWRAESSHFPALEHLEIAECFYLEEIPQEIGEIPTLELIEVKESSLAAESAMRIQEEQREMGNDTLQVRVFDYWITNKSRSRTWDAFAPPPNQF